MTEKEQTLLAQVLNLFAQKFDRRAVLRGGMVLRILGSPRFTNDLDYIFVPYRSKKEIVAEVLECVKSIEGATIKHSLNSKCLRVIVSADEATIQIEAKVATQVKTATVSTRLFSIQFGLPQRLIHVQDYSVALAHKMAAWNERRLIRDLYDIWFYLQMNVIPDRTTLAQRLKKPSYSRTIKPEDRFSSKTIEEFYDFIRAKVAVLSDEDIAQELTDYLPQTKSTVYPCSSRQP